MISDEAAAVLLAAGGPVEMAYHEIEHEAYARRWFVNRKCQLHYTCIESPNIHSLVPVRCQKGRALGVRASRVSPVGSARARASRPVAMSESPAGAPTPGPTPGDAPRATKESDFGSGTGVGVVERTEWQADAVREHAAHAPGAFRLRRPQGGLDAPDHVADADEDAGEDGLPARHPEQAQRGAHGVGSAVAHGGFGRLRFAESLRHAEKVEVCKAMGFRSKRKGDTVFSQGDPGNTFYIVLSGSVSVSIRAGESESEEHVASLYNGDSFGELALLREGSVRSATVRAETDVEFLVISREDYNTILGAVTEEQLAEKIDFLIALPAFAGVPLSMIRSVAYVLTTREFDRNAVVFRQGEETEDIFFVERGGIKFVREVMDARARSGRMGVHRDGPAAAGARRRARKRGLPTRRPPPPAWTMSRRR